MATLCTQHREPNGLLAAQDLPLLLALAAQIPTPTAPSPAYCAVGNLLSMCDAHEYLDGHCVEMISFRRLQANLAICAPDMTNLEYQVRALQEHVNQETLPEGSTRSDTQEDDLDPNSNPSHPPGCG